LKPWRNIAAVISAAAAGGLPMNTFVILILVWLPVGQSSPVITHRVFASHDVCTTRMEAMKEAFEQMDNHTWLMVCERMHAPE
jgi:hypothetical protein